MHIIWDPVHALETINFFFNFKLYVWGMSDA